MEEGDTPNEWNMMFNNLETSMSPWKFPPPTASTGWNWSIKTKADVLQSFLLIFNFIKN
jgi:hypothetical protein